jgi:hypothetical protein
MNKLIAILYVLYFASYMLGCSIMGDVNVYSPQGDGNAIEKSVEGQLDSNVGLK